MGNRIVSSSSGGTGTNWDIMDSLKTKIIGHLNYLFQYTARIGRITRNFSTFRDASLWIVPFPVDSNGWPLDSNGVPMICDSNGNFIDSNT